MKLFSFLSHMIYVTIYIMPHSHQPKCTGTNSDEMSLSPYLFDCT